MIDAAEMPIYRSHKKVRALEIANIVEEKDDDGKVMAFKLIFAEAGWKPRLISANSDMFSRYKPVNGDFFVVYADGYSSFSPRTAFLEGYARA